MGKKYGSWDAFIWEMLVLEKKIEILEIVLFKH